MQVELLEQQPQARPLVVKAIVLHLAPLHLLVVAQAAVVEIQARGVKALAGMAVLVVAVVGFPLLLAMLVELAILP